MKNSRFRGAVCWIGFVLLPAALALLVFGVFIPTYKRSFVENEIRHPVAPPELTITRFYSDLDGSEVGKPIVQHYDGAQMREYRGTVVVRYIEGGGFEVTVHDAGGAIDWCVKDLLELLKYVDPETMESRKFFKSFISGKSRSIGILPSLPAGNSGEE